MLINLDKNTQKKIEWLIRYVYQTVRIKYAYTVANDGTITKYYNRENMWSQPPIDKNESCGGYWDCELEFESADGPIDYKFIYNPDSFDEERCDEEYAMNQNAKDLLLNNTLDNIFLKSSKNIIFDNISGFNDDHRGSDHTKICLDFEPHTTICQVDNKIAFKDFVKACFDIKSHKFDFWYELYCGTKDIKDIGNSYVITVCFDHGS
ncbi:hypothetical protein QJ856_gp0189 [Tupanvirus deep ocean]|uniref:Uncharacterized protein n=2 Tax=Tupanvirus TaxID=2094720 RepID=A0AC62A9Y8_9VIRU|nr:hypothetical protein QJ856_gp0189 [Tupanvirus deep ocean]QKU34539.1 hypothetical protein [Tupanvirus deep ocean]